MTRKVLLLLALGALMTLSVFAAACGGDDDGDGGSATATTAEGTETALPEETGSPIDPGDLPSEEEAMAFFEQAVAKLNGGDVAGFIALFSDKGLFEYTGNTELSTEELRAQALESLAGGPTITVTSVENIEPYERNAGMDVNSTQGNVLAREYYELLPYQGSYLIDAYQRNSPEVAEGTTSVTTSATEFAYELTEGDPNGDGNVAFVLNNAGAQPHEIVLLKVAEGPALEELVGIAVESDPSALPAEIEEVVGSVFAAPGGASTMAFVEPLVPGRYAMMCFIPDQTEDSEGVSHAALGMAAEFAVE